MTKALKQKRKKPASKTKPSKNKTAEKKTPVIRELDGYQIVHSPTKPDFSDQMIEKLVAATY